MATKKQDEPETRPVGRPPANIDENILLGLAKIHATQEECAAVLNLSPRTIIKKLREEPYKEIWERGRAMGRASLRRLQWAHAQLKNSAGVTMSIHLSKHWLGETEKAALEVTGRIDSTVEVTDARDRLNRKLDTLAERISGRVDRIIQQTGADKTPAGAE